MGKSTKISAQHSVPCSLYVYFNAYILSCRHRFFHCILTDEFNYFPIGIFSYSLLHSHTARRIRTRCVPPNASDTPHNFRAQKWTAEASSECIRYENLIVYQTRIPTRSKSLPRLHPHLSCCSKPVCVWAGVFKCTCLYCVAPLIFPSNRINETIKLNFIKFFAFIVCCLLFLAMRDVSSFV